MNKWWRESLEAILWLGIAMVLAGIAAIIGTLFAMGVNRTLVTFGQKPFFTEFHTFPGGQKVIVPTPVGYRAKKDTSGLNKSP